MLYTASSVPTVTQASMVVDVLVIGSGFAGLCMAIKLQQAGLDDFCIIEKSSDIGGTWFDNRYPGCACDIPSHLYSLSFEPRSTWSRMYPTQPEILAYLQDVVEKHRLRRRIRLRTAFQSATWDEDTARWHVTTSSGTITCRVLVSGMGALHYPSIPTLPGLADFQGEVFHSARWNLSYDLVGKRIAVIGTGASAIQFIPEIAPRAAQLTVYQRTPPWILPKVDPEITPRQRSLMRFLPGYRFVLRQKLFVIHEMRAAGFAVNPALMAKTGAIARRFLTRQVNDPALRANLTPEYTIGCKRVLISNTFYPTLQRQNVELVTDGITEIRPHAVVTQDGTERPADVIIFGTGFRTTDAMTQVTITGREGQSLNQAWAGGMRAYLGTAVPGFPNFFMLLGPNTGLGHNSVVIMIEAQVRYVMSALRLMRRCHARAMAVRPEVDAAFNEALTAKMNRTVWQSGGCQSWYQDSAGRNTTLWPGFTVEYSWHTRAVRAAEYQLTE